jgi:hypothetical protein
MFVPRRLCTHLAIFVVALAAFALFIPGASARPRGELVLATSAEDEVLRARIVALSPTINPEEARLVAHTAYTTGRELKREWRVVSSPTMQNFLINIGARKRGYCWHWAEALLARLDALALQTIQLHWAEADVKTDTEHNVIVVTGRGQPMAEGILLDNWRKSGRLLWGPVKGDVTYAWKENQNELFARIKRRAPARERTEPKTEPPSTQ